MKDEHKEYLLKLARKTLENTAKGDAPEIPTDVPQNLDETRATFVTLTKNNELRGCIGHLYAINSLYEDIIQNTVSAATEDPRFEPVTEEETKDITIEISILTQPEKVKVKTEKDWDSILKKKPGVIIRKGMNTATFLPTVWEELPTKEEFLSKLCQKAGLEKDCWKNPEELEVEIYYTETFKE